MTTSTCIKCEGTKFEMKELLVTGARFRNFAIQCASCGGVVGIEGFHNTQNLLLEQNRALNVIAQKLVTFVTLT